MSDGQQATDYYVSYSHTSVRGSGFGWDVVTMPHPVKTKQHVDKMHELVSKGGTLNVVVISFQPL